MSDGTVVEPAGRPADAGTAPLRAFADRLAAVLRADERIAAAWLTGSLARGAADAWSDVDVLIAVRGPDFPAFVADWRALVDRVGPTVMARRFGPDDRPIVTAVTPDWLRFDIVIGSADDRRPYSYAATLLFDREGIAERAAPAPAARDPLAGLPFLVEEFIRGLGLLPIVIGRDELFVAMFGVAVFRNHLAELMLLETGGRRGGAKRLNPFLTDEQRAALATLPAPVLTRESLIRCHVACAELFLPRARRLMRRHGMAYPEEFERATRAYLHRTLGLTLAL